MHVRHAVDRPDQPRRRGDVHELFEAAIARDRGEELVVGEHARGQGAGRVVADLALERRDRVGLGCHGQTSRTTVADAPSGPLSMRTPWSVAAFTAVRGSAIGKPRIRARSRCGVSSSIATSPYRS